jgi:hypothetical protein
VTYTQRIFAGEDFRVVPLEKIQKEPLDRAYPGGSVLLCLARTALPLARLLETQGWVGKSDSGQCVAQLAADTGAGLTSALLLDSLGFVQEAQELERALWQANRAGAGADWMERVSRLLSGESGDGGARP